MDQTIYTKSILEVQIKILSTGWKYICQKHPDLNNHFQIIINCLEEADEIWISKQDKKVYLYYKQVNQKYICAVCKHHNSEGFLITAYYTYKLQGEKKIWSK